MKFGLIISKQHPPGVSMVERFREHIEQVRAARDAGFDLIVMGQHYLSAPFQEIQTLPSLARLAAEAGTMRVGATVLLLPLLNPVDVAEQVATLDVICEGRFIFGAGLGYREEEYEAFGVQGKERVARFLESLEVIKRLWTEDEVTHHGRFFHLTRARMALRPVQKPHPPIWFAANNDGAVERSARMANAWVINPHAKLPVLQQQMALYRKALREAGKPFPAELPMIKESCTSRPTAGRPSENAGPSWKPSTRPTAPGGRTKPCRLGIASTWRSRSWCRIASSSGIPTTASASSRAMSMRSASPAPSSASSGRGWSRPRCCGP